MRSSADVEAAISYARAVLGRLDPRLVYHDVAHTADNVVPAARRLAHAEGLDEHEVALVEVAAWFHDLGYVVRYEANEAEAVAMAQAELPALGFSAEETALVGGMIWATRVPQQPRTPAERVIVDADLFVLGTDRFQTQHGALQRELAAFGRPLDDRRWLDAQANFLLKHRYFTASARRLNDPGKLRNLAWVEAQLRLL